MIINTTTAAQLADVCMRRFGLILNIIKNAGSISSPTVRIFEDNSGQKIDNSKI